MLTWYNIQIIVRKVTYIFDEWWSARSAINIRIILFLNDKSNVVLVLTSNVDLAQHSNHCKKSFLYNLRMMNGELSYQHSYHCSYKNLNVDCRLMIIALTSYTSLRYWLFALWIKMQLVSSNTVDYAPNVYWSCKERTKSMDSLRIFG